MTIIKAKGLTKKFPNVTAVSSLNLSIEQGEIYGLVGPDGAGKTTTMRLLTAILDPTSGSASVDSLDTVHQSEEIKERIGYMSQNFGLYPDLTVEENIHFYADIYEVPKQLWQKKMDELLHISMLFPFKERLANNLSGGMKQKLALVCALIHTPKILFLDEPTNGVDPVSRRDFWQILYELLKEKVTIFVSTSYLDEAERCGRVGLINKGSLLAQGSLSEIKKLHKEAIIEIRTERPREAVNILKGERVRLFGSRVHLVTDHPEKAKTRAEEALKKAGFNFLSFREVTPSLEDVFISMLSKKERK